MHVLESSQRSQLENTITKAHAIAEKAATTALKYLCVDEKTAPAGLSEEEKVLRRKLRAHGRQLGDRLSSNDKWQDMDRLVEEVAYEHWHRMLFARFLGENNLLMYPDPGGPIPITLEECQDLVEEENARNTWELAARFAAHMLPQIFQKESPIFALNLPPENQQELERLLADLPADVFKASDSLGWVYQYWQSDKKDAINRSEVKIGERELPAVTQLFTEPYMVNFLLDNSLGAWWAARRLAASDLASAQSEKELRARAAIPGLPLNYLRFVREGKGWTPAAGTFAQWPQQLSDFKLLDPCCGSGHFLVAALHMLVPMRMHEENLSLKEAIEAVLKDNVHGLELDQRCVKIAAFALAFSAWTFADPAEESGAPLGYCQLPELHVACSGLPVTANEEDWVALAPEHSRMRNALKLLYEDFCNAPILRSLLSPSGSTAARVAEGDENLFALLHKNLVSEEGSAEQQDARREASVMAQGLAKAAILLNQKYTLISTNVPYLVRGKQGEVLQKFCNENYREARNDIATVFLERCLKLCAEHGTVSTVMPQNWLFLVTYKKFRKKLLEKNSFHLVARLGAGAFTAINGEVVKAILLILSQTPAENNAALLGTQHANILFGLDVSSCATDKKSESLQSCSIVSVEQKSQLDNFDSRITLDTTSKSTFLRTLSYSYHGLTSGDMPRMKFFFWEIADNKDIWIYYQGTVSNTEHWCGLESLLRWERGGGAINILPGARKDGQRAWGKKGVLVSQMGALPVALYSTFSFDNNTAVIIPDDQKDLPAIWCFCSSPEYNVAVRKIDQKLNVTNATLVKVPFDLERWQKVAEERYPNGLPLPYSDDPTQWIFHGHPCKSVVWDDAQKKTVAGPLRTDASVLHVAVARLLGYKWPAELDPDMELAREQRDLVNECAELASHADRDGIVCIPAVAGELQAAERLLNLLMAAYGDAWSMDVRDKLLQSAGCPDGSLDIWLKDHFFIQHCQLFQNRPFIWHIWDGLPDGFAALVNYHTLTYRKLESLTYKYLGNWMDRQKEDVANKVDGAQTRLDAATTLQKELQLILQGESPHDIFVRWKPVHEQPVGWKPDLNDGVRLNIRPFLSVPDVGKKGAGILRDKPKLKWDKDRGKDQESAPLYFLFGGERINDYHLTLAEKERARAEEAEKKASLQTSPEGPQSFR